MRYVDPSTGDTYPLTEARWRADNGHYLNLAPAEGLRRKDIDASRHSFTFVHVTVQEVHLRQLDHQGQVIDEIRIRK